MNYDVLAALRIAAGRRLIAAGKGMTRAGARLLRHPSTTPALRIVQAAQSSPWVYDPRRDFL